MATETQQSIDVMNRGLQTFYDNFAKTEKASKAVAENVTQLAHQLRGTPRTMMEMVGEIIKLPPAIRELSSALIRPQAEIKAAIDQHVNQLRKAEFMLSEHRQRMMSNMHQQSADQVRMAHMQLNTLEANIKAEASLVDLDLKRMKLKEQFEKISGKQVAMEYLLIRGFKEAIERSGEVNQALMQANSLSEKRQDLVQQVYDTQIKTGASFQNMLGATRALTNVWPKARADFQSTLEVVVQMEEGLGVSFEHSSEMARVFQLNLKTPAREVADQIAIIANSTSLAADEATRFAIEIGKALRLLGPGGAANAKEVTKYVEMMAGRMRDVGGDASEVVKLFSEMTKGSAQGFMLRGMSGVNQPGALGTQGGAQAAMQGVGRLIDRIVTAAPGTMAYTAQLEAAAQIIGTSTESVRLYKDMLKEANKPLDEHAKLQQRWQEQMTNANQALHRVRESFVALIQRALLPIINPLAALFGWVARIVAVIASSKAAIIIATVAIGAAIVKTIISMYQLGMALHQVSIAAAIASRNLIAQSASQATAGVAGKGIVGLLGNIARSLAPAALMITLAAAVGVAVGLAINKIFPQFTKSVGEAIYNVFHKTQYAGISQASPGQKSVYQVMSEIRREALRGNMEGAVKMFEEGKYKVAGLKTQAGAQAYLDFFVSTMAEVRERLGTSTVTVRERETLEHDRQLIELTRQQVLNSGDYLKRAKEFEDHAKQRSERDRSEETRQRMIRETEWRMVPGNIPTTSNRPVMYPGY